MTQVDLADIAVIVGVILVAVAMFMALGAAGVIGFAGGVLIVLGAALAWRQAAKKTNSGAG